MTSHVYQDYMTEDVYVDFGDGVYTKISRVGDVETDVLNLPIGVEELVTESDYDGSADYESGYDDGYSAGQAENDDLEYTYEDIEQAESQAHQDGYDEGYTDGRNSVLEDKDPDE